MSQETFRKLSFFAVVGITFMCVLFSCGSKSLTINDFLSYVEKEGVSLENVHHLDMSIAQNKQDTMGGKGVKFVVEGVGFFLIEKTNKRGAKTQVSLEKKTQNIDVLNRYHNKAYFINKNLILTFQEYDSEKPVVEQIVSLFESL